MKAEIYGAPWCNYCKQAVLLCESKQIEYVYVDVDEPGELKKLEERMGEKVKTIPQIFVDGLFLQGGYTGLKQELGKNLSS